MKRIGRLAGNIGIGNVQADAPPSTRSPYVAVSAGAKLVQHGELGLNDAFNRGLYAIQSNLEEATATLPRLASVVLEPATSTYGFTCLKGVARGEQLLTLGAGASAPPVWLFHGIKASDIASSMAIVRKDVLSSTTSRALDVLRPSGILPYTGADYVTDPVSGSPTFLVGDSTLNGVANYIAPVLRVRSDIEPYDGATQSMTVLSVDYDGFIVDSAEGYSFKQLHGCAGTFVEIANTDDLDGLYRVERVVPLSATQEKLIVSSCGFHKVTVEDAANAVPGRLVRWAARPDHDETGAVDLPFAAYIVAVIGNDLYLSNFSDAGDPSGQLAGTDYGVTQLGTVGEADSEFGDNTLLATNMLLHQDADLFTVAAVSPAAAPLLLPSESLDGVIGYLRNPLGFSLNPVIVLDTDPGIRGGDYYIECSILTGLGSAEILEARSRAWHRSLSSLETRAALRYMIGVRDGDASLDADIAKFSTPAQQMLGPSVWVVTVTKTAGGAASLAAAVTEGNTVLVFANHPGAGTSTSATRAKVLQCNGNTAHLYAVSKSAWDHRADQLLEPIVAGGDGVGSTFTVAGSTFRVTEIVASPAVVNLSGDTRTVFSALQAAYDNAFMSDRNQRGNGYGRRVEIHEGYPIQLLATTEGNRASCLEVIADSEFVSAVRTKLRTGDSHNTVTSDWGYESTDGTAYVSTLNAVMSLRSSDDTRRGQFYFAADSLGFADRNTGFSALNVVYLSFTAPYNALCYGFKSKTLLGALYGVDHTAREEAQPNVRSAVGSGVLRSSHKRLIYSAEPFEYSLHFNASLSDQVATWSGPSGAADVTVGENLLVQYQDADGNIQTFVTTLSGADGSGVSFEDAFPSELEDTTVSAGIYKGRLDRVYVAEGEYIVAGRRFRIPASTILHNKENSDLYAIYRESTGTVSLTQTPPVARGGADGALVETLAIITVVDSLVTEIKQIARPIIREQNTPVLYVGKFIEHDDAELSYNAGLAHFETLGEAFTFIEVNATLDDVVESGWIIRVITDTEETEDTTLGITLPLRVPCNGLVIEGAGEAAVVSWSVQTHLLNLGARADLLIRNVHFAYTGAYDAIRELSWIPDAGDSVLIPGPPVSVLVGTTECDNARMIDCALSGGSIACLHVSATSSTFTCQRVTATSCRAGVYMYAHGVSANGKLTLEDVTVSAASAFDTGRATAVTAVNLKNGITVNNLHAVNIAAILASGFQDFTANGVYVNGDPVETNIVELTSSRTGAAAILSAASLTLDQDSETSHCGIYVDEVDSTTLDGLAISGGATGVRMAGSGSFNTLRVANASISFASAYAVGATGGSELLVANTTLVNCAGGVSLSGGTARLDNVTMKLLGVPENTAEAPDEGFCGIYVAGSGVLRAVNSDIEVEHEFGSLVGYAMNVAVGSSAAVSSSRLHGGVTAVLAEGKVTLNDVDISTRSEATASSSPIVSLSGVGTSGSTFTDIRMDGTDNLLKGVGISLSGAHQVSVAGLRAKSVHNGLVYASSCDNLQISGVNVRAESTHDRIIELASCSYCSVYNVVIDGAGKDSGILTLLSMTSCDNFVVSNFIVGVPSVTTASTATPLSLSLCSNGVIDNIKSAYLYTSDAATGLLTLAGCTDVTLANLQLEHAEDAEVYALVLKDADVTSCSNIRTIASTLKGVRVSSCEGAISFSDCRLDMTDSSDTDIALNISYGTAEVSVCGGRVTGAVTSTNGSASSGLLLDNVVLTTAPITCENIGALTMRGITAAGTISLNDVNKVRLHTVLAPNNVLRLLYAEGYNNDVLIDGCEFLGVGNSAGTTGSAGSDRAEVLKILNSTITCLTLQLPISLNVRASHFQQFYMTRRADATVEGEIFTVGQVISSFITDLNFRIIDAEGSSFPQDHNDASVWCRIRFSHCDFSGVWKDTVEFTGYTGEISCDSGVSIYNSVIVDALDSLVRISPNKSIALMPQWYNIELNDLF